MVYILIFDCVTVKVENNHPCQYYKSIDIVTHIRRSTAGEWTTHSHNDSCLSQCHSLTLAATTLSMNWAFVYQKGLTPSCQQRGGETIGEREREKMFSVVASIGIFLEFLTPIDLGTGIRVCPVKESLEIFQHEPRLFKIFLYHIKILYWHLFIIWFLMSETLNMVIISPWTT